LSLEATEFKDLKAPNKGMKIHTLLEAKNKKNLIKIITNHKMIKDNI